MFFSSLEYCLKRLTIWVKVKITGSNIFNNTQHREKPEELTKVSIERYW